MADQASPEEQIAIASTIFTTDATAITKVATGTTWPGGTTTIPTTLSLYGLGHGSISVITQTFAGSTVPDPGLGVETVLKTEYQVVYPTASAIRLENTSQTAASPSRSSLSPISTSPPNGSKGISKASAAGIGIGCAILGALIATALARVLLRRRSQRVRTPPDEFLQSDKGRDLEDLHSTSVIAFPPIHDLLPQPLSRSAITSEMSRLGSRIKHHATNFYSTRTVDIRILELEDDVLAAIGFNKQTQTKILNMLASPEAREGAISYIVARKIFACISMPSQPGTSFLPPSIATLQRNLSATTTGNGFPRLESKWRATTARLVTDSFVGTSQVHVQEAHSALITLLRPVVDLDQVQQWSDSMMSILSYAARFGWTLFSQLAKYDFVWEEAGTGMVVYPGLVQITNDEGEVLSREHLLTTPLCY
ncbi:hypothetical protein Vi05172_g8258 [Venturia inaequalis]|uniref:Uncharacterized protein n=1 Tax=Venturia inaequalis TaxID=5025 RepID=A0A8H3VV33_VENIN|nr:hypothetical protein EG327_002989 [Venturia inaequalis]RDI81747.1 hypothetical protein Vi05172_g8258 [Venturia inaequalis]